MISQVHVALGEKLQQELQMNEQVIWSAYPDRTRRAKQAPIRALFPSWIVLRIIILAGMFLIVIFTSVISKTTTFLLPLLYGAILLLVVFVWIILVVQRQRTAQRRFLSTIYAITTRRLVVLTLEHGQFVQNSYYAADLGRIDLVERRSDGWGDIVIGSQRVQSRGYSLAVVSPRLSGVERVREVATLLTRLKAEQHLAAPQPQS